MDITRHFIERLEGCLVGLRVGPITTVTEHQIFARRYVALIESLPSSAVTVSDYRGLRVISDELEGAVLGMLRVVNPKVRRSAILLPAEAVGLREQLKRLAREAGNPGRRILHRPGRGQGMARVPARARRARRARRLPHSHVRQGPSGPGARFEIPSRP